LRHPLRLNPPLIYAGFIPQPTRDLDWVDAACVPPSLLVAGAVNCAMMHTAEGYGEFVAGLAAERARLQVAQVMRVGGLTTADEAWLLGDSSKMLPVAIPARRGNDEGALVDALGNAPGSIKVSACGRTRLRRSRIGNGQSLIASRICPGWSELR
jgi:hypothetical protein